jgi:hypothetical protein
MVYYKVNYKLYYKQDIECSSSYPSSFWICYCNNRYVYMLYMLYKEVITMKEGFDVATHLLRLFLWRYLPLFLSLSLSLTFNPTVLIYSWTCYNSVTSILKPPFTATIFLNRKLLMA